MAQKLFKFTFNFIQGNNTWIIGIAKLKPKFSFDNRFETDRNGGAGFINASCKLSHNKAVSKKKVCERGIIKGENICMIVDTKEGKLQFEVPEGNLIDKTISSEDFCSGEYYPAWTGCEKDQ